ncbi:hypothetical protein PP641_gp057 [Arthrobacter phage SilentRX]|uniref:Uncharacterized protein n=1 Tax=Arthrobacter phage SilentRX TaxID=2836091 RepID=A0A8F3E7X0_9CAUD|nr:hypothetical protein PP641_gp057 [Arthrobacter phage SilentRX]QWY82797.1 hypothetical protein SEA_SILENTRX_57 [Arthrobacter phage SilentRX]
MIGAGQVIAARRKGPVPNEEPIFQCKGDCGRMTRPTRVKLSDAPGTVTRTSKEMCGVCTKKFDPPKHRTLQRTDVPSEKLQRTLNSLDAFTEERNRRIAARQLAEDRKLQAHLNRRIG